MARNCSSWIIGRAVGNSLREVIALLSSETNTRVTPMGLVLETLTRALRAIGDPGLKEHTPFLSGSSNSMVSNRVSLPYGGSALTMAATLEISAGVRACRG